jgi:hypothetical protein
MPPVPEEKEVERKLRWLRIDREAPPADAEERPPLRRRRS